MRELASGGKGINGWVLYGKRGGCLCDDASMDHEACSMHKQTVDDDRNDDKCMINDAQSFER